MERGIWKDFYENADWYLRNLDTYKEYHGLNSFSLGNGEIKEFTGVVSLGTDYEISFNVFGEEYVYADFSLTGFSDDLDLHLYKQNSSGKYILEKSSDAFGDVDETFFKALSTGSYKITASFYENLGTSGSSSPFNLVIDSKSFQSKSTIPNDPLFKNQWSLFNTGQADGSDNEDILAPEGWKIQSKSPDIVVAVIDSGVRTSHEDLINNVWHNTAEINGNGIDDDQNGYIDDVVGWNFVRDRNWWEPQDHGTHVAGLIAAEGNNSRGISGVTWDAKLMCLDVFSSDGRADHTDVIDAIYYAANNGSDVINLSLGASYKHTNISAFERDLPDLYRSYFDALSYAVSKGSVVVCAAGNETLNTQKHFQVPASFSRLIPGVISVAAVGNLGEITGYSNYSESITIAAPGGDDRSGYGSKLLSTYHLSDTSYAYMNGTSMAAPLVSGAAALILQKNNNLSPAQVEEILTKSAFKYRRLGGMVQDGNYLDLEAALLLTSEYSGVFSSGGITFVEGNVYRLNDPVTGRFLFSSNSREIDLITGQGWVNEGAAYASPSESQSTVSLHRFLSSGGEGHFYTANEQEKEELLKSPDFVYEGVSYEVYPVSNVPSSAIPVFRYLGSNGNHLFSTSVAEQNSLNSSSEWINEGIAWYGDNIF